MSGRRLGVVGAGVAGLAAAVELTRIAAAEAAGLELAVFESEAEPGGKVKAATFAGTQVELGADSVLARGPQTLQALERLDLMAEVRRPATTSASIWNGRRLLAIPQPSVLGIPLHPWRLDVVRAVGPLGAARAGLEPWLERQRPQPDGSVAEFLEPRLGRRLVARLVDPLLGAVYAGPARGLSTGAVAPQLLAAASGPSGLLRGLRRSRAAAAPAGPALGFLSFAGGLKQLVEALGRALPAGALRLSDGVRGLEPGPSGGVRLRTGTAPRDFDGVILALPVPEAARLLAPLAEGLGELLRRLDYASVATVTLAYREDALTRELRGSGFLVADGARRLVTACTYLDRKWPELRRPGLTLLRASVGRAGDESALALDDTSLVTSVHLELRRILGLTQVPIEVRIQRWHGALPQYRAGHLGWREAVAEACGQLPAPVLLCGAAFGGVGVAACLESGAAAARALWERTQKAAAGLDRPEGGGVERIGS